MAPSKTALLSSLLVSKHLLAPRQGPAVPRPKHPGLEAAQTPAIALQAAEQGREADDAADAPQAPYYKALTLKVDRERFTKLKSLGVQRDLRSQALMTEALDLLFTKHQL